MANEFEYDKERHYELSLIVSKKYRSNAARYKKLAESYAKKAAHMVLRANEYEEKAEKLRKELAAQPV